MTVKQGLTVLAKCSVHLELIALQYRYLKKLGNYIILFLIHYNQMYTGNLDFFCEMYWIIESNSIKLFDVNDSLLHQREL